MGPKTLPLHCGFPAVRVLYSAFTSKKMVPPSQCAPLVRTRCVAARRRTTARGREREIEKNYTVTNNSSTQEEEVKVETHFFFLGDFAQ